MVSQDRRNDFGKVAVTLLLTALMTVSANTAKASPPAADVLDAAALVTLEQQAAVAQPREQCFLYTQVLRGLTEIEGQQLADGQEEQAASTLQHIDVIATKLHSAMARDAKKLKDAELLMERTSRRLSDMVHVASGDSRDKLQSALQHVNAVHNELLAQVFAK